ncbi:MAG: isocitrate/isopropylmalate dehydrogenase family protein [Candidatus Zixiibacteriota bacterium]
MAKYRIAWLPGDGVGIDVMEAARIVLDKLGLDAEYPHGDIGWEFWCKEGNPLPDRTIELLKKADCALFGAITSKPKEEAERELIPELQGTNLVYSSPIVGLRQLFDLGTNLRPCKGYEGNPLNYRDGVDLCVFRENTEDLYSGVEFFPFPKDVFDAIKAKNKKIARFEKYGLDKLAVSMRIISEQASTSIITAAFEYAKKYGYKSVTVVEKPNVIRETSGLFVRTARTVAKKYPDIELWETNIDAMCMWLLKNPLDYGVIVTSNMFGDIISDLCAQLVGGLGFACSGNIGREVAVFEPTHGSAPKYAGQYKVNPMAMLLTTKMMLDWLDETDMANALESAIAKVIKDGKIRTYDMGGSNTTLDVGRAVADNL